MIYYTIVDFFVVFCTLQSLVPYGAVLTLAGLTANLGLSTKSTSVAKNLAQKSKIRIVRAKLTPGEDLLTALIWRQNVCELKLTKTIILQPCRPINRWEGPQYGTLVEVLVVNGRTGLG